MRLILSLILSAFLLPNAAFAAQNVTLADCSIASMSGSSQALGTAFALGSKNYTRKYLLICNTGAAGDNVGVNLSGGTAALAGTGTLTLVPGACLEYPKSGETEFSLVPSNNVNVIGTSSQPVLCYEGR